MTTKQEIIEKLRELGINSENCYPKKSFLHGIIPVVGLYKTELSSDFYFYTTFDKTLYVFRKIPTVDGLQKDIFMEKTKYLVPLSNCEVVWTDKPLEETELPDENFGKMSLRHYAAIHLKVPNSGILWLDEMIKESKR